MNVVVRTNEHLYLMTVVVSRDRSVSKVPRRKMTALDLLIAMCGIVNLSLCGQIRSWKSKISFDLVSSMDILF